MTSTQTTPRYRNFSTNMPLSTTVTPRAQTSLITVEKEPERDPEEDCFMCRQAHVYVKPIGIQHEHRVARHQPPPLTRAQIDELSRKKHLTKKEVKKLLQCYFPEIKDVKYFQLHKYHSCCYDPNHIKLCKNHITALQHERGQHSDDYHQNRDGNNENSYKDYEREKGPQNRVSFVRIKIEPTKGIPTRFLGPTALPESLADMLLKQVNRLEKSKTNNSNSTSQLYNISTVNNPHGSDDDDDEEEYEEEYEEEDDSGHDNDENDYQPTDVQGRIVTESSTIREKNKQQKVKLQTTPTNDDLVVEDLDELNRLYGYRQGPARYNDNQQMFSKPLKRINRQNVTKKKTIHGHRKPKLKHWELKALEQAQQEPCNCRHHVLRLAADQVVYDWCRCKDHQHKDILGKHQSTTLPPLSPPEVPKQPKQPRQPTPPPPPSPPPPRPPPRPKPRKVRKRSIAIDATEQNTTELALAYDPSAVDYDMIQEAIYYRTSSGRLIKPEVTNAFTYDTMPQAINTMIIDPHAPVPNKAEVLYMTPNGQLNSFEGDGQRRGKIQAKTAIVSNPGTLYNGQAQIDTKHSTLNNHTSGTMPVLKLPPSVTSPKNHSNNNTNNGHQPTVFTLARFSPDKPVGTPASQQRSLASGSQNSQTSGSQARSRSVSQSMQKSTKPTYSNLEPTPNYGSASNVMANRRWFDQPLGDQNLRPVHDGQYGLIAGTSTNQYQIKSELAKNSPTEPTMPKNGGNCTIS